MIKYDYLDTLYRWKVEAELELEKLEAQKNSNRVLSAEDADHFLEIEELKILNLEQTINRYATAIRSYIQAHTNG